ncbi:MAG: hypothetical protein JNN07_26055 [Verrucomicrobiales bacterium]|nr:hypothetical protein [Verrucomicrobiales bacterium]
MKPRTQAFSRNSSMLRGAWLALLGCFSATVLWAQDKPTETPAGGAGVVVAPITAGAGRVVEFQNGSVLQPGDSLIPSAVRPSRGEQQPVSAEIRAQLLKFESARDAYLKRQKELTQQLKGAGEDQRKAVRDQLKGLREQWLEQSLQFRREARSRIADLKTELPQFEALKGNKPALDTKPDRRLK